MVLTDSPPGCPVLRKLTWRECGKHLSRVRDTVAKFQLMSIFLLVFIFCVAKSWDTEPSLKIDVHVVNQASELMRVIIVVTIDLTSLFNCFVALAI